MLPLQYYLAVRKGEIVAKRAEMTSIAQAITHNDFDFASATDKQTIRTPGIAAMSQISSLHTQSREPFIPIESERYGSRM